MSVNSKFLFLRGTFGQQKFDCFKTFYTPPTISLMIDTFKVGEYSRRGLIHAVAIIYKDFEFG